MPTRTAVTIPRTRPPVFPTRCAGCGAAAPGSTYPATAASGNWFTGVFGGSGRPYTVEVPACDPCRRKIRRRERMQFASVAVIVVATFALVVWRFKDPRGFLAYLVTLAGAAVCVAQLSLWDVVAPPPLTMTKSEDDDEVEYRFRDPAYAAEFGTLNKAAAGK